jgi:hypothetical protein
MKYERYSYVGQLPFPVRLRVILAVSSALLSQGLKGRELEAAIYKASNSKVSDLSGTIDLNRLGL